MDFLVQKSISYLQIFCNIDEYCMDALDTLGILTGNWNKPFIAATTSIEKRAKTGVEMFSLVKEVKMKESVYHHKCQIICMLLLQFGWICPWYTLSILHILCIFFGWTASLSTGTLHVIIASWGQRKKLSFLEHRIAVLSKTHKGISLGLHVPFQTGLEQFRTIL